MPTSFRFDKLSISIQEILFRHLFHRVIQGQPPGQPKFEAVAAIAGRGFKVRREDMKKLLIATRGKVFTLQNMDRLIECIRAGEFRSR